MVDMDTVNGTVPKNIRAAANARMGKGEILTERTGIVTHRGTPMTLLGDEIKAGQKAPEFSCRTGFGPGTAVTLASSRGKIRIFSVAPSLDTSVCERQAMKFDKEAAELGDDVEIIQVSMDLPPAQGRFCKFQLEGKNKIKMISDYADRSFGLHYGFLLKEWQVHSRGLVIVDKEDVVRYVEYCPKLEELPDFDKALQVLSALK
jgi:thiol peroxidase